MELFLLVAITLLLFGILVLLAITLSHLDSDFEFKFGRLVECVEQLENGVQRLDGRAREIELAIRSFESACRDE